jgi:hypothetical protein
MQLTLPQKILFGFMILLVIYWTVLLVTYTREGFHNFFYSFLFGLTPLIGGLIAMMNSKVWGGFKTAIGKAVFFVGFGMFLWGAGEMVWSYYNFFLGEPAPYPSIADLGFAPSIFFYGIGALYLSRVTGAILGLRSNMARFFVILTPLITIPFSWYILVIVARGGVLIPSGETPLKVILDIAYPLGSLIALSVAVIISGLSFKYMGGRYKLSILSVLAGLFVMFIGDTIFSYTTTVGTFYNANYGDLILTAGTFLLTFGVLGFYRYREPINFVPGRPAERVYNKIATNIINEQGLLMGPVAWSEAEKVSGIRIVTQDNQNAVDIDETVDGKIVLDNLVEQYKALFGPAAIGVCKRAVSPLVADLDDETIPTNLK